MAEFPDDLRDAFLASAIERCHPRVREWTGEDALARLLGAEIDAELARIDDDDFATTFVEQVPIDHAGLDDYRLRIVETGLGPVLAGIAFVGLDPARPFVQVYRELRPPATLAERDALVARLADAFTTFAPERVRTFAWDDPEPAVTGDGDQRLVAGPLDVVRARVPAGLASVELAPASGLGWYGRYVDAYDEVRARRPHIRDVASAEARSSLEACRAVGGLFEIRVDGDWAGVVAARPDARQGVAGWLMIEILLAEPARGRSLGAAVHRHLAGAIDPDCAEGGEGDPAARPARPCLWGTIGAVNAPALRAARGAGRRDLGGWRWWTMPH